MLGALLKAGGLAAFLIWATTHPGSTIQYMHEITLIGSTILILLYGFGFKDNLKYVAVLFLLNIVVRIVLGGFWGPPVEGTFAITQGYGILHHGVDVGTPEGTAVIASRDGRVSKVWMDKEYGLAIIVDHEEGFQSLYAHNRAALVKEGDKVSTGDKLALSGNTGKSTGPHLHFEIRENGEKVNPEKYVVFEEVKE